MILVGTVHQDLHGPERLRQVLELFQPRTIGVECPLPLKTAVQQLDEAAADFERELRKTILPARIRQFHTEFTWIGGYEVRETLRYAQATGATTVPIDEPSRPFVSDSKAAVEELVILRERGALPRYYPRVPYPVFREAICKALDKKYAGAKLEIMTGDEKQAFLSQSPDLSTTMRYLVDTFSDSDRFEAREKFMAERVLEARPDMVVCGAGHAVEGAAVRTLYDRVRTEVSSRVLLGDIKSIRASQA